MYRVSIIFGYDKLIINSSRIISYNIKAKLLIVHLYLLRLIIECNHYIILSKLYSFRIIPLKI